MSDSTPQKPPRVRVARPDELSAQTFEFISAIDDFKRTHMISIVTLEQVIEILGSLGYTSPDGKRLGPKSVDELEAAVEAYKEKHERLFPNWSEIHQVVSELGYRRDDAA